MKEPEGKEEQNYVVIIISNYFQIEWCWLFPHNYSYVVTVLFLNFFWLSESLVYMNPELSFYPSRDLMLKLK